MNVYIVGLRRSGTTILFDTFFQDANLHMLYEPLNRAVRMKGGGSMATDIDFNAKIRTMRQAFVKEQHLKKKISDFNFGAGSNYLLESSRHELPHFIKAYLSFLINSEENTVLKFVRATFLIDQLYHIAPNSYMIHIQKNPIRFVTSHIFGIRDNRLSGISLLKRKTSRILGRYSNKYEQTDPEEFFRISAGYNHWSQEDIANCYIRDIAKRKDLEDQPAYIKLLFIWKEFNEKMIADGQKYFGEKFLSIEHETFCNDPVRQITEIYNFLDLQIPKNVIHWVKENVKSPRPLFAAKDPRWEEALQMLGIDLKYLE